MNRIKLLIFVLFALLCTNVRSQVHISNAGYKLVFSEEFDKNGKPDSAVWNFEYGFVRNKEFQWYQENNAYEKDGVLVIEGRKEKIKNPAYDAESNSWRKNREFAEYSSASINTRGKKEFLYGRFEIRARIDTAMGLWPAIWTLGVNRNWPGNGEIDLMESYPVNGIHYILANVLSVDEKSSLQKWHSIKTPLSKFLEKDKHWPKKFHIWRMDWDEKAIRLYLDNEILNETLLTTTIGPDGFQPFNQPHYILLNLAIGGDNGGDLTYTKFPTKYEIDYVRVYQKK
ncbi:MAG: glycoside hydrolase family 16 protein [Paludibacter sp.]|nr:glycoside hydrolase family 16 protein [Paludibacter sp.]